MTQFVMLCGHYNFHKNIYVKIQRELKVTQPYGVVLLESRLGQSVFSSHSQALVHGGFNRINALLVTKSW